MRLTFGASGKNLGGSISAACARHPHGRVRWNRLAAGQGLATLSANVIQRAGTETGWVVGLFNPILYSPLIARASLNLTATEQEHTALSKRVREVVILSVGAVWKAP